MNIDPITMRIAVLAVAAVLIVAIQNGRGVRVLTRNARVDVDGGSGVPDCEAAPGSDDDVSGPAGHPLGRSWFRGSKGLSPDAVPGDSCGHSCGHPTL